MKASDIMTSPIIAVSPGTTVGEIAALLFEKRAARAGSWWLRLFSEDERDAARVVAEGIAGVRRVDDRRRLFQPLLPAP